MSGTGKPLVRIDRFLVIERIEEHEGITTSGPPMKPLAKCGIESPTLTLTSQDSSSGSRSKNVPIEVLPTSVNEFREGSKVFPSSRECSTLDMRCRRKTVGFSTPI